MKALVLVAHGSRRAASNEEVTALSKIMTEEMSDEYPIVEAGFLELADPSIPDAISCCVHQGATDIYIVPYFLSSGRHVVEDIPGEIDKARTMHNHIEMTLLPHIGGSVQMKHLIREVVIANTGRRVESECATPP